MNDRPFSQDLEAWLKSKGAKTIMSLDETFAEKSFAMAFLLLLAFSALPLPTGGITNVFEVIALLLAAELIIGRRSLWLPKRWRHKRISHTLKTKALPRFIRFIAWIERFSRPRMRTMLQRSLFIKLVGLCVFVLVLGALVAPPFSGLDTLPSLGVVIIALSLLLEDVALFIIGSVIGAIGIGVLLTVGSVFLNFFN